MIKRIELNQVQSIISQFNDKVLLKIQYCLEMKASAELRQPRITLKQYIHSNSLRKKAMSKCSSREDSTEKGRLPKTPIHHHQSPKDFCRYTPRAKRSQLIEEIKVKLAQNIPKDSDLVTILKLFEQLISLYDKDLNEQTKEKEAMVSMMRESKGPEACMSPKSKQSKVAIEQNFCFYIPDEELSFQELSASRRPRNHKRGESDSLAEIPNINLLLMTKNKESIIEINLPDTKQTENKKEEIRQTTSNMANDTFCLQDYHLNPRQRKSSVVSNASNLQNPQFKKQDENSQLRISLRSSLWNNFQPRATRNKYEQYKR